MSSFKRLNKADVTTVNYHANKRWNFNYTSSVGNSYVVGYVGKNEPFNITGSTTTNGQYQSLVYAEINHMFYQNYTNLLDTGSLMFNLNTYESASQYRPTGSYFNYNINPYLIKQFPTNVGNTIGVLSINQDIFGSKILPHSFLMVSSSNLYIRDDGNGNLYNIAGAKDNYIDLDYVTTIYFASSSILPAGTEFIGNIFYAHGLIVLQDQALIYQNLDSASISFQNEHIIYENEIRCIVKESDYNLSYNPSLVTGSYTDGILRSFATGSTFQPYVTTIGLYNDDNELLMVAKLGKPMMLSPDTDMTFIVKYDT